MSSVTSRRSRGQVSAECLHPFERRPDPVVVKLFDCGVELSLGKLCELAVHVVNELVELIAGGHDTLIAGRMPLGRFRRRATAISRAICGSHTPYDASRPSSIPTGGRLTD